MCSKEMTGNCTECGYCRDIDPTFKDLIYDAFKAGAQYGLANFDQWFEEQTTDHGPTALNLLLECYRDR